MAGAPFERVLLRWLKPGAGGVDPVTGNPVQDAGDIVVLQAHAAPFKATQLRYEPGVDPKVIKFRGDLVVPRLFPPGIGVGEQVAVEYNGYAGMMTITSLITPDIVGVDFGTYFEGDLLITDHPDYLQLDSNEYWELYISSYSREN